MPRYIDADKADIERIYNIHGECYIEDVKDWLDEQPTADVVEVHGAEMRQLWSAVYALADMVCQFGYSTKFRKQDALCDGGLSALENALSALTDCGCPTNSNGTITTKKLWQFMDKIDGEWKE
jgi:hypothetical protein